MPIVPVLVSAYQALQLAKARGGVSGLLVSKTAWGASALALPEALTLIGPAVGGDPAAIGKLVLFLVAYAVTLFGRWSATR